MRKHFNFSILLRNSISGQITPRKKPKYGETCAKMYFAALSFIREKTGVKILKRVIQNNLVNYGTSTYS